MTTPNIPEQSRGGLLARLEAIANIIEFGNAAALNTGARDTIFEAMAALAPEQLSPLSDGVDALGEALFNFSASINELGLLTNEVAHQRYEAVVSAYQQLDAAIIASRNASGSGWLPIETAPRDGSNVIVMYIHIETQCVFNAFYASDAEGWDEEDRGWWSYEHSEVSRIKLDDWMTPTHWMPLPDAPTP